MDWNPHTFRPDLLEVRQGWQGCLYLGWLQGILKFPPGAIRQSSLLAPYSNGVKGGRPVPALHECSHDMPQRLEQYLPSDVTRSRKPTPPLIFFPQQSLITREDMSVTWL